MTWTMYLIPYHATGGRSSIYDALAQRQLEQLLDATNAVELRRSQTPLLCAVTAHARGDEVKRPAAQHAETVRFLLEVSVEVRPRSLLCRR